MSQGCATCGAPVQPGLFTCPYCNQVVSAEAAASAIPCPQCKSLNAQSAQQCGRCHAWLVVQCVFCQHVSPWNVQACASCHEPFAGAVERKAARDAERQRAQTWNTVAEVATVATPVLGAVAGALFGASFSGSGDPERHDHHHASNAGSSWYRDDASTSAQSDSSGGIGLGSMLSGLAESAAAAVDDRRDDARAVAIEEIERDDDEA